LHADVFCNSLEKIKVANACLIDSCESILESDPFFCLCRFDFGSASGISTVEEEIKVLPNNPPTLFCSFGATLSHQERDAILDPETCMKTAARRHET